MESITKQVEHVVLFQWKTGTSDETIEGILTALRGLQQSVPGILSLTCGTNFCERAQGYTHGLVVRLESRAALEVYGPHPAHQSVVSEFILPHKELVLALDYEV